MQRYRSKETFEAVQYLGQPIPGITCEGTDAQYEASGCDSGRRKIPHVHGKYPGGMRCLKVGDWIMPEPGGPWNVVPDDKFRANVEVPENKPVVAPSVAEELPPTEPAPTEITESAPTEAAPTEITEATEPTPTEATENNAE